MAYVYPLPGEEPQPLTPPTPRKLPGGIIEPAPNPPKGVTPPATDPTVGPMPGETPGALTPATGTTGTGAKAILQAALDQYGLGDLADWAWSQFQAGFTQEQILSLADTPYSLGGQARFKQEFPEYDVLAKRGEALSPGQIIQYRTGMEQLAQQFGLPSDFNTKQLASDYLLGNVSLSEAQQRFQAAQTDILTAPPENLAELHRLYGMTPGDLLATYVDETQALPLLQRKAHAAALGVASERTGYGQLGAGTLENLDLQGITQAQALAGFSHLAGQTQLFQSLDRGEQQIGQDVQLGAEFGGNAQNQQTIAQRQRRRLATFSGGGGYATGRSSSGAGNVGI